LHAKNSRHRVLIYRCMRLRDFEDFNAKGTLGKNRQIYTSLYDYHAQKQDRAGMVGWMARGSQERNYMHVTGEVMEGDSVLDFGCGVGDLVPFLEREVGEFKYTGVDINPKFIEDARTTYPGYRFRTIDTASQVRGRYDVVVALGVFTWYITEHDFRSTIMELYRLAGRTLLITCLHTDQVPHSWENTYRGYDEGVFRKTLPELDGRMEFSRRDADLVVVVRK
jgi:2-polyprenyl-3-methyl-5-hydroxy-6-metoxy-1,4-benzoquinol methylase